MMILKQIWHTISSYKFNITSCWFCRQLGKWISPIMIMHGMRILETGKFVNLHLGMLLSKRKRRWHDKLFTLTLAKGKLIQRNTSPGNIKIVYEWLYTLRSTKANIIIYLLCARPWPFNYSANGRPVDLRLTRVHKSASRSKYFQKIFSNHHERISDLYAIGLLGFSWLWFGQ